MIPQKQTYVHRDCRATDGSVSYQLESMLKNTSRFVGGASAGRCSQLSVPHRLQASRRARHPLGGGSKRSPSLYGQVVNILHVKTCSTSPHKILRADTTTTPIRKKNVFCLLQQISRSLDVCAASNPVRQAISGLATNIYKATALFAPVEPGTSPMWASILKLDSDGMR
eukprot:1159098-Pelagomonas_calceolata.AAC.6